MSTAVLERIVEQPKKLELITISPAPGVPEKEWSDPHPLLPVFIAGAISLMLAGMLVGSILVWLAMHNSGVLAR
jgi:hypothetical protein